MKFGSVVAAAMSAMMAMSVPALAKQDRSDFAVSQLRQGDLVGAESALAADGSVDSANGGRLINLGVVYVRQNRLSEARDAFLAARAAPDTVIVLSDGHQASSRTVAREKLSQLGQYAIALR